MTYNEDMENRVPGRYDGKEAYRRFRAELLRAHLIDLDKYGGTKSAAELLRVSQQQVSNWKLRGLPMWLMVRIDAETDMNAEWIYQLGESRKVKPGLESDDDAQSEILKQIAKLLQGLKPKRRG